MRTIHDRAKAYTDSICGGENSKAFAINGYEKGFEESTEEIMKFLDKYKCRLAALQGRSEINKQAIDTITAIEVSIQTMQRD